MMGSQVEVSGNDSDRHRRFTRFLLEDVHALERMLEEGRIEGDIGRIGAEQELVLVDENWRPAPAATQMIERLPADEYSYELALFNLEYPVGPLRFEGQCLRELRGVLQRQYERAVDAASEMGLRVGLFGILPSLRKGDLTLEHMAPVERYRRLNEMLTAMRGRNYEVHIRGTDELITTHDNLMLEATNTSFQIHFQVPPDEFAQRYNIAQLALAPVLAASVNSALLGRYRLWAETRIALFQQSLDTRTGPVEREIPSRVSFGRRWVDESVLELFQEDIGRFKVLFSVDNVEDPAEALKEGRAPQLEALRLHAGTVYRWNRAVYGIADGKPTLRIENRALPAGPTITDEVANAAFWFGLMAGLADAVGDVREVMEFEHARDNFAAAAQQGLEAQFTWLDGRKVEAKKLLADELLPLAYAGLRSWRIDEEDIYTYLGVIEERVESGQTGAAWQLNSLAGMQQRGTRWERVNAVTAATLARQRRGEPVHTWELARLEEAGGWRNNYLRVEQLMTADVISVGPDDSIDLAANLMNWHRIRHILVEDDQHHLLGLLTHRHLLKFFGQRIDRNDEPISVRELMVDDPIVISPDTPTLEAIDLLKANRISCLPVVKEDRLVGVITEDDFVNVAGSLLRGRLGEDTPPANGGK